MSKKTSQQKKELSINTASELQRELVTSSSIEAQTRLLSISELTAGKPLLSYGDHWVPILIFPSDRANMRTHIDVHLFGGIKISNISGASELHRSAGASFLIERYNTHLLKNPRYQTPTNHRRTLLGAPIYSGATEVEAFAREAQITTLNISNSRPYTNLIISGMLYYNPMNRRGNGFSLRVLYNSNFDKLLDIDGSSGLKIYNSKVFETFHYSLNRSDAGYLGKSLRVYENNSSNASLSITSRYGDSGAYIYTNEWRLSSLQEPQSSITMTYRTFPAFVEFETNGLLDKERYPSLVFPLFENMLASTSQNKRMSHYISTIVDGNKTSKVIQYESILPLSVYKPSLTISPKFKIGGLQSGEKIKGTIGLIPQFSNREELSLFSEYVYIKSNKLEAHKAHLVQMSPVVLYHPRDHNIALLENSHLGIVYNTYYRQQSSLYSSPQLISFSSTKVSPANITLFSEENFSNLLNTSTLLSLEKNSYASSSEGFVNPDIWNILFLSVTYNEPNSIVPSPLIGVFKNVNIAGGKFLKRVDYFTRVHFYESFI